MLQHWKNMTVCSWNIKLANYINFIAILMFPDLKYLKQGFLENLESLVLKFSVFVLNLKNNSFPKSWKTRRMCKKMKFLCCDGLMDCHFQLFGRIVWLGKAYPRIWSVWSHNQAKHIRGYDLSGGIWIDCYTVSFLIACTYIFGKKVWGQWTKDKAGRIMYVI